MQVGKGQTVKQNEILVLWNILQGFQASRLNGQARGHHGTSM